MYLSTRIVWRMLDALASQKPVLLWAITLLIVSRVAFCLKPCSRLANRVRLGFSFLNCSEKELQWEQRTTDLAIAEHVTKLYIP